MNHLAKEFFERTIHRNYLALVWGDFKTDSGTITGNIGRNLKDRKIMDVFPEGDYGKHAVTHYQVLTSMLAPALFLAATGSLLISANNRLARVVDRCIWPPNRSRCPGQRGRCHRRQCRPRV